MFGRYDARLQLAIALLNVDAARRHIEDIDKRIQEMHAAITRGDAPAKAEHTLAALRATRAAYVQQVLAWEPELIRLQALTAMQH